MDNIEIKRDYTVEEWAVVRQAFQNKVPKIMVGDNMTSDDIKKVLSQIDQLLPTALIINSYIKTDFENIENHHKSLIKSLTYDFKIKSRKKEKVKNYTDSEATGRAYKNLRTKEVNDVGSVEDLREFYNERYNFMYSVVESLKSKKEALITYGSMLKLEMEV